MSERNTRACAREPSNSHRTQAQDLSWSIKVSPGVPTVLPIPALGVEVQVSPLNGGGNGQRPFTFHLTATPSPAPLQRQFGADRAVTGIDTRVGRRDSTNSDLTPARQRAEPISGFGRERSRSPTRNHRQDPRHWRDRSPVHVGFQRPQQMEQMPPTGPNNHSSRPSNNASGTAVNVFSCTPPTAPRSMRVHSERVLDDPKAKINNLKLALAEDQKCLENLKRNVRNYGHFTLKRKTDECLLRIDHHNEKLRELEAITKPTFEAVPPAKARHMQVEPLTRQSASGSPFNSNPHNSNYRNTNCQIVSNQQQVLGNPPINNSNFRNGNPRNGGDHKVEDHQHTNGTGDDATIPKKQESSAQPFQEDPEVIAKKVRMLIEMGLREEEYLRKSKERGF